jgi:hypothetical protein
MVTMGYIAGMIFFFFFVLRIVFADKIDAAVFTLITSIGMLIFSGIAWGELSAKLGIVLVVCVGLLFLGLFGSIFELREK